MKVKDCIKGNVKFEFYRKGYLYYNCENGFQFRVPIDDCGDAAFNREEKGIMFMRYIRKELKELDTKNSAVITELNLSEEELDQERVFIDENGLVHKFTLREDLNGKKN